MKNWNQYLSLLVCLFFLGKLSASEPVWVVSGLKMPESVEYDSKHQQYYVSNINGGVMEQDNNGSIGLISEDGKLINAEWIKGLHSPKGLTLYKNKLYVADVKELVVINVETAKIIARYPADESMVLNGITVSKEGAVYVSDWMGNRIYTLDEGELKVWLADKSLNSPNGLWIDQEYLYVASWGANPKQDFTTETTGALKKITLSSKKIKTVNPELWVNMDGIFPLSNDKWLISDFIKGEIILADDNGKAETLLTLKKGAADFYYIRNNKLIVVPLFMDNQVVAYRLP